MSGSCATSWIRRANGSEPRERGAPRALAAAQVVAVAAELVLAAPEAARAVLPGLEARKEQRQAGG